MYFALLVSLALGADADDVSVTAEKPKQRVDFARDIQPIFKQHCYECHGSETQESGLRLDIRARALEGGDHGPLLVAGKSKSSQLVERVTSADDDEKMPPDGEPLSKQQVALLRTWIDGGANWPQDGVASKRKRSDHWSFQPPRAARLPEVKNERWVRNEIDRFVLAVLEEKSIAPAPPADREMLVRRLFLDLVGLPPNPAELETFLADQSPRAYERLVDRLLDSPHFGERWGRHWLDLARYADSNGYERDDVRPNAWRYRDWVVQALNTNMPYDQFVIEQLAGDLLPEATVSQRVATGFYRMTIKNTESGINKEDYRNREVIDRVNTTGTAFLGLSVGCAQCHSHKYDPISQREYYQFYAFFNNLDDQDVDIEATSHEQEAYTKATEAHESKAKRLKDRQSLLSEMDKRGVDGWRKLVRDENAKNGHKLAALEELQTLDQQTWFESLSDELRAGLDLPKDVIASLDTEQQQRDEKQQKILADYFASVEKQQNETRAAIRSIDDRLTSLSDAANVLEAMRVERAERSEAQNRLIQQFETALESRLGDLKKRVRTLAVEKRYLPKPYIMVSAERTEKRRATHVLLRGDFKQHGAEVKPRTFEVLNACRPRGEQADRLDFARWLASPENPLVSRVAVNHMWQHLFGRGLVSTVDDFGEMGDRPSHPKLLDWLAADFQEHAFDVKRTIRQIVTSATYRQSSRYRPELAEIDPLNTLLARQARFRVEGEIVRDLFLEASGLLSRKVGGSTIRPIVDDSIRDYGYKYNLVWPVSSGSERYRRGLYIHLKRTNPYPSLIAFDAPEGNVCTAMRHRSNTPLQALTMLNDPVFVECAQALSRRILEQGPGETAGRIRLAGRICLSRELSTHEAETLAQLYEQERDAYAQSPALAKDFVGEYAVAGQPEAESAAWTAVARTIMNSDQFVTRE